MGYNIDYPKAEYHQIIPRLFLGGHMWLVPTGEIRDGKTVYRYQYSKHSTVSEDLSWNYVVSAYFDPTDNETKSFPKCDMRLVLFDDTEHGLTDETWARIKDAVDSIVDHWLFMAHKVLVRCQAGYNRSGLIMCLVLMRLGYTAESAITLCRESRGKDVLINSAFEGYVYEREAEYRVPERLGLTKTIIGQWASQW